MRLAFYTYFLTLMLSDIFVSKCVSRKNVKYAGKEYDFDDNLSIIFA